MKASRRRTQVAFFGTAIVRWTSGKEGCRTGSRQPPLTGRVSINSSDRGGWASIPLGLLLSLGGADIDLFGGLRRNAYELIPNAHDECASKRLLLQELDG